MHGTVGVAPAGFEARSTIVPDAVEKAYLTGARPYDGIHGRLRELAR